MRFIIQPVEQASVSFQNDNGETITNKINKGILIYVAIHNTEGEYLDKIQKFSRKIGTLQILKDKNGNITDTLNNSGGELLIISNFTLYGDFKKGNKVNYSNSAKFGIALDIYNQLVKALKEHYNIKTGKFGAMMTVSSTNIGPLNYIREL